MALGKNRKVANSNIISGRNRAGNSRIVQNDMGSCRYNGFWHPSMDNLGITVSTMRQWCLDINNLPVPDQYNYCDDVTFEAPGSQRMVELCKWDWWDQMDAPYTPR